MRVKSFKEFCLLETEKSPSFGTFSLLEAGKKEDKVESYRNISYKLAEIFALYGFFFAQKEGFFDARSWPKLMGQIIKIKDPSSRWDTIIKMSKFLQSKTASPALRPAEGEFGSRGNYDYGLETQELPKATEFLKAASNAAFKNFSPEEQQRALSIMDEVLKNIKPLQVGGKPVKESVNYVPPTQEDLLRTADSIGTKLMNMYDVLDNLKSSFPNSATEIDSFINGSIIPNSDKLKSFIEEEIPKVSGAATAGYLKKLESFDKTIDALIPKYQVLKNKVVKAYQPIEAAKEFEDSAMAIILKVRQGIMKQAEMNARWVKSGDVVSGTTDITDPKYSGDLQVKASAEAAARKEQLKKKGVEDLADFLSRKYTLK